MTEEPPARILVEGGSFWRQTRYTLWFLWGCTIGIVVAFIIAFNAIQSSRFNQCEVTNSRNKETTRTLEQELSQASIPEAQRKQTLRFTIALIDDLAPLKDCNKATQ